MPENPQPGVHLRPVDLARAHRLSTQAIRNYEDAGILPAAERTRHGYRTYTPLHARALSTFLALVPGHGHATATSIMQALTRGATDRALRLVDESHVRLLEDRRTLEAVELALRDLAPQPLLADDRSDRADRSGRADWAYRADRADQAEPTARASRTARADRADRTDRADRADTFIGPLSRKLGLRAATLRKWEQAGLLHPRRDPQTGYRVYSPADVRDAQLIHQLRRGGYLLDQIAPVLTHIHAAGGIAPLESMLHDWHTRLTDRGRALLTGAAALDAHLAALTENGPDSSESGPFST
ncbi:MAG: MerR family transcriptional regulator [Catenulispora sp.]|nr:MerR family transcriptional regulator [Catenulispora sp.]